MEYRDSRSELGAVYLVPNKNGIGKTLVRKPHPAPTSTPLDDDFDAATQTYTIGVDTGWDARSRRPKLHRPSQAAMTVDSASQIMDDDFDITYTAAPAIGEDPSDESRSRVRRNDERHQQDEQSLIPRRDSISTFDPLKYQRETGNYTRELERMFAETVDLERSMWREPPITSSPRKGKQAEQIQPTTRVPEHNSHEETRESLEKGRRSRETKRDVVPHKADRIAGPKSGQNFEMVRRRVLEDGPERTVTISTWREEVSRKTGSLDGMSVYYVNADDYADAAAPPEETFARERFKSPSPRLIQGRNVNPAQTSISQRLDTVEPSRHEEKRRNSRSPLRQNGRGSDSRDSLVQKSPQSSPQHTSHSSDQRDPHPPQKGTPSLSPPRTSSSARKSPEVFNQTRSGSTVSSAKPTWTASLEVVLNSCEPSLLHLAPSLASLGIKSEDHLRAVGRLTEATRDREVREEALRLGITVVEWAILLDKLQTL